jgi:PIN domain nuclease of toxin-antitoxin system
LSDVSVWEICLKWQARKLQLPAPPRRWVTEQMGQWSLSRAALEPEDLFRSSELAELHKDPFDRLLVAQTLVRNAHLVTPDPAIHSYPVAVIW